MHEVEELTFRDLLETGRQIVAAYIEEQAEDLPRPEVIEHEGKTLHRLPEQRELYPYKKRPHTILNCATKREPAVATY